MIDKCKKLIGLLILIAAAVISVYLVRMYYPEFYYHTIHLTMAGDVDGLADYISSFGYGAFLVSIGLLIFCN
ncbi:MAG TPA: TVP38/TMEM64 family protein, partial [Dialister sp.]|nr:TVP38/TMEM64 family protein [Dialister sp.]